MFAKIPLALKSSMFNRIFQKSFFAVAMLFVSLVATSVAAQAETRTLNLYFPHTKESIRITYKKDGRYIPAAMEKLNWFFRDWRRNVKTKMSPKTIDLLWELYQDLGAKKPAQIVSGYRSAATNGMLRRIGRKVARRSQHIQGRAIDVYFPDVPTSRLRGSALARRVGGVGYYPRSGTYGFVHIDSGSVRNWPRISSSRLASLIRSNRSTIGARFRRSGQSNTRIASAKNYPSGPRNIVPKRFRPSVKLAQVKKPTIPLPRARPLSVAMAAAAVDTYVVPVSAPAGKQNFGPKPTLNRAGIGTLLASNPLDTAPVASTQRTNKAAKGSFVTALASGRARGVALLRPMQASTNGGSFWWSGDANKIIRRDGAPQAFTLGNAREAAPEKLSKEDRSALEIMIAALTGKSKPIVRKPAKSHYGVVRSGKSDSLRVNRAAKSDLLATRPGQISRASSANKIAGNFEAVLKAADKPLRFVE